MKPIIILLGCVATLVMLAGAAGASGEDNARRPCTPEGPCATQCSHESSMCARVGTCGPLDVDARGYPLCIIFDPLTTMGRRA